MTQHYLYRLWFEGVLQYIGQTNNMKQRMSCHKRDKLFDAVDYIFVDKDDIDALEMYLIKKHLPPLNNSLIDALAIAGESIASKYENMEFTRMPQDSSLFVEYAEAKRAVSREGGIVIPNSFLTTLRILNKETGVLQELNLSDKVVYCYIQSNSDHSVDGEIVLCESQESISNTLLMDRKTINRCIKKLEGVGLVTKGKCRVNGVICQAYSTTPLDCGVFKFVAGEVKKVVVQNKQTIKPAALDYEDDIECPF